jgi:hypothetical protein
LPFADVNSTSRFIYRIYIDFKKALTDANIWAAFRGTGLEWNIERVPYRIIFHPEKLRESKAFQELWEINFLINNLSSRRRMCRFG